MESMTKTRTDSNHDALEPALNDLKAYVQRAARQGVAAHEAEAVARSLGIQVQPLELRQPPYEFAGAFAAAAQGQAEALLVLNSPIMFMQHAHLMDLVAKSRLPTMFGIAESARAGGLMSYDVDRFGMWRRVADYVDKILKGAKPAELPVEQPTTFELVINLKTAKALGLTIPPHLLVLADEVIQ